MSTNEQLQTAIQLIDDVHRQDPQRVNIDGAPIAAELIYAERMSAKLQDLVSAANMQTASEPLQLAVRSQHLRRWQIPRDAYPMDRVGYLKWRTELKNLHAAELGQIMQQVGYEATTISRAQSLVKKERLKSDAEAQMLEDAACLVFLEFEFAEFAAKQDRDKIIDIVRKTWTKMSDTGHALALKIPFDDVCKSLVTDALQN